MTLALSEKEPSTPPRPRILIVSGPNLQLLGRREPEIYGTTTLEQIHQHLITVALAEEADATTRQSNHEGDLVTWVGEAALQGFNGMVLNPGAYTHTSLALYDAIRASALPAVEVHLSNPDAREAYRHHSTIAAACLGRVAGFGAASYELGLRGLLLALRAKTTG